MNSATETAAVEEIEMSELRAGEETGMERGESETLIWYLQFTLTTLLYLERRTTVFSCKVRTRLREKR